jgi:hypothetical protein
MAGSGSNLKQAKLASDIALAFIERRGPKNWLRLHGRADFLERTSRRLIGHATYLLTLVKTLDGAFSNEYSLPLEPAGCKHRQTPLN